VSFLTTGVDNSMRGSLESAVGPAGQHFADIDIKCTLDRWCFDPFAWMCAIIGVRKHLTIVDLRHASVANALRIFGIDGNCTHTSFVLWFAQAWMTQENQ